MNNLRKRLEAVEAAVVGGLGEILVRDPPGFPFEVEVIDQRPGESRSEFERRVARHRFGAVEPGTALPGGPQ